LLVQYAGVLAIPIGSVSQHVNQIFSVIIQGTALRNKTDLLGRNKKMVEKALSEALSCLNILCEDREIVLIPEQETAVSALLHGRDVMAILPTGFGKSMIFTMFALAQTRIIRIYKNLHHCYFAIEKHHRRPTFRDVVAELHSNGIVV